MVKERGYIAVNDETAKTYKTGVWTYWREDGTKRLEGAFENGKREGVWVHWDDKGKQKPEGTYKNGKREGDLPSAISMDAAITELMAKDEQPVEGITVQHVLIAFKGAPRVRATRSKDEAKKLAEKIWGEALGGATFKDLMNKHSDDGGGGEYPMTKAGRGGMVGGFGNVGFRLKIGEIGVAPWHAKDSPYGWHIIKRVK
jgi:hypothetical protein